MQNETFEPGQELYLENGNLVEYVCAVEYGHVVREVYESDDVEPYWGDPFFTHRVFTVAPKVKQEQRVAELDAEIEEKEKKLREVSSAIWDAQNSQKKMLDMLKRNSALAQIENVMNGNITHVVVIHYRSVKIVKFPERMNAYNEPKLILRIGLKSKKPDWGYSCSDSYQNDDTFPFSSEQEAIAFAKQHILSRATEEEIAKGYSDSVASVVGMAQEFGVTLPDFFLAAHRKNQLDARKKAQADAQAELDKATKALAELGGGDDA